MKKGNLKIRSIKLRIKNGNTYLLEKPKDLLNWEHQISRWKMLTSCYPSEPNNKIRGNRLFY